MKSTAPRKMIGTKQLLNKYLKTLNYINHINLCRNYKLCLILQKNYSSEQTISISGTHQFFVWFSLVCLFVLTSLLEYNYITMLCQFLLYNKVNQLYAYIYPHIPSLLCLPPTLPISPLLVIKKHQADLPVECSCFPLAMYYTFGSVYMSTPLSHLVPAYPYPSPCTSVHSLHLRLYSCPAPRFFRTFFFFKIQYICVSIRYLFFPF